MDEGQEALLNALGFNFVVRRVEDWDKRYMDLLDHRMHHGHCSIARNSTRGQSLGNWIYLQRNKPSKERLAKLSACGVAPKKWLGWDEGFERLLLGRMHNGSGTVDQFTDPQLYEWMRWQRRLFVKFKQGPDKVGRRALVLRSSRAILLHS